MIDEESILSLCIVQANLSWENPSDNYRQLEGLLEPIIGADLIVLPEMFSTGFTMHAEKFCEPMHGKSVKWLLAMANSKNAVVTGSLIIEEKGKFFNRLIWATPEGDISSYDKKHLFSFAGEDTYFSSGNARLIVDLKGWKICPLICYDLRFPVWSRNQSLDGQFVASAYDVLLYVANWPEVRSNAWNTLLEARAHENQSFVVGVNRVGLDGNNIAYAGGSCVISPKGEKMVEVESRQTGVKTVEISMKKLKTYREKFGAWRDKDRITVG